MESENRIVKRNKNGREKNDEPSSPLKGTPVIILPSFSTI
jgi:hypothetical protein